MSSKRPKKKASTIRRLIRFVKPFTSLFIGVLVLNTIFSTLTAVSVAIIKPLLELIFQTESSTVAAATTNSGGFFSNLNNFIYGGIQSFVFNPQDVYLTLLNFSVLVISIFILKNVFKFWAAVAQIKFQEGVIKSIRDSVFRNMTSLSVDFFSKNKEGSLISAITNDINIINSSTISAFVKTIREAIQIVLFLVLLLSISPFLTLISFSASAISLILLRIAIKYIRRYATRMQGAMADYTGSMQETVSGIRVVKAYNAEDSAVNRFKNQTKKYLKSAVKHRKITSLTPGFNEVFAIAALCVVLFVGGSQVLITKEMSGADLMTFLFYLFAIMSPITKTFNNITKFQRGFVAAERVFKILDAKPSVKSGKERIDAFEKEIEVRDVSFAYGDYPAIDDASFKIEKSKKIAFVGASGSGKSTMLDLIIRFYDPQKGKILIDGGNIKDLNLRDYRDLFGLVGQETILFNDTIANNIRYGYEKASDKEIMDAAKMSNAYDFTSEFTDGFSTLAGDRGATLSGGERQRVAIARALIRDPQILLFDEATSALDAESEKAVQEAINKSLKDRTAIIVAHRLSTIIDCDEILVFERGKIVERGAHEELISKGGVYKKLYDLQFAESEGRDSSDDL